MMMEQNAEEYGDKPWNLTKDDRTGFQKRRETNPGTLAAGNDDGTGCQKSRETSPGTLPEPGNDDGTKPISWKN